ncbi:MAG TPA: type IV secretory system conjugative DNA transfer family protein, partial [Alphaproteobacteria bacterium]|nr:type IV secretory system conjugative DNA transfer family protein [Alphaproteobacteria bacterium]
MAIFEKFEMPFNTRFRDVRPAGQRLAETFSQPSTIANIFFGMALALIFLPMSGARFILAWVDVLAFFAFLYMQWFNKQPLKLPFKLPAYANMKDPRNPIPGKDGVAGMAEGILYLGTERDPKTNREIWLTNSDARTHMLFLGTTGTGKTEGLKSIVANSLIWGSGFIYVDGKADTELWANLYSLARRFGRDDDILVLNYLTGNSDDGSVSNTFNPFATGSSSYLSNMLVDLMPDAGGDNAMWKERAVALIFALMPALTYKRDKQGLLLDISIVRDHIELKPIVRLSRDASLPERIIRGLQGYLATLPGYVDEAFDDEGNEKPPSPDAPMYDLQIARQQHGYLSMQFTRAMQSLGDEYSYIFRSQLADVDVLDVVLNRRILIGLLPALEKSDDELANLGKIIASTVKGMMGATLGSTLEGAWEDAIESKMTRSSSPFMTVFDEVGYYVARGMAVMAAQARSLGFSLIFSAQDLPAMERRVKQQAQSIAGNCNLKIFGKLEDPLESKKFFEEHVGTSWVYETQGFNAPTTLLSSFFVNTPYIDNRATGTVSLRARAAYDHLRKQREGQVHMLFHEFIVVAQLFHAQPRRVTALRVQKLLPVPSTTTSTAARERMTSDLSRKLEDDEWIAAKAMSPAQPGAEVKAMADGFQAAQDAKLDPVRAGIAALASITDLAAQAREEGAAQ